MKYMSREAQNTTLWKSMTEFKEKQLQITMKGQNIKISIAKPLGKASLSTVT